MKVEGGQPAYCVECKQHGHYITWHHRQPVQPRHPSSYWLGF